MDDDFVWPAAVMLAGIAVWIVLALWHAFMSRSRERPSPVEPALCLTAGGLVLASGFG
ncbi:MAG: hypothetical protein GY929_16690 [Actinomycetia bacterium]|nr:hypothetical protein [Actinomycetes bacterium]